MAIKFMGIQADCTREFVLPHPLIYHPDFLIMHYIQKHIVPYTVHQRAELRNT